MDSRDNSRGYREHFVTGQHLKLTQLEEEAERTLHQNQYLFKEDIPPYPRPELHVSHLSHDTDTGGIFGISAKEGFCAPGTEPGPDLLWWSLSVDEVDIESAEKRLLEKTYPGRTEEEAHGQKSFLGRFATSPAFLQTSRLGSYRFTFSLKELLEAYSTQHCSGSEPVLRVYETVLYKQEVMYSVLVHSPANHSLFDGYPLLTDSPDAVCAYEDGHFIWRPEAMCETHSFQLIKKEYQNQKQMAAHLLSEPHQFYVWDHVAVAFHLDDGQMLSFDKTHLRWQLNFCEPGKPTISDPEEFVSLQEAADIVNDAWPFFEKYNHTPLWNHNSSCPLAEITPDACFSSAYDSD